MSYSPLSVKSDFGPWWDGERTRWMKSMGKTRTTLSINGFNVLYTLRIVMAPGWRILLSGVKLTKQKYRHSISTEYSASICQARWHYYVTLRGNNVYTSPSKEYVRKTQNRFSFVTTKLFFFFCPNKHLCTVMHIIRWTLNFGKRQCPTCLRLEFGFAFVFGFLFMSPSGKELGGYFMSILESTSRCEEGEKYSSDLCSLCFLQFCDADYVGYITWHLHQRIVDTKTRWRLLKMVHRCIITHISNINKTTIKAAACQQRCNSNSFRY